MTRPTFLIDSKATGLGQAVSPFYARLPDGRSVEDAYHQAKGYSSWREGKGKPAIDPNFDYEGTYLRLYQEFAAANPALIDELAQIAATHDLVHPRARTSQNPATVLTQIIQERSAPAPAAEPVAQSKILVVTPPGQQRLAGHLPLLLLSAGALGGAAGTLAFQAIQDPGSTY